MSETKIDIAALLAEFEPDPAKHRAILEQMIRDAAAKISHHSAATAMREARNTMPVDHSQGFGLPPDVVAAMAAAVPDAVMRDVVREQRAGVAKLDTPPSARGFDPGGAVLAQRAKGE
jgi:hypothetical protein